MLLGNKPIGSCVYMGGVPAVLEKFCWSWGQLVQCNAEMLCKPGEYVHYERATFSDHAPARNGLVKSFKGDFLLMLDTDHQFEPDLCVRMRTLMQSFNLDVLTGVYCYKSAPHVPLLYAETEVGYQPVAKWDGDFRLFQIDSAGAGCLMVNRTVFDRIKRELKQEPFDRIHPFSEDHSFFRRCKQLDIDVWFDPKIEAKHLNIQAVGLDDFRRHSVPLGKRIETMKGIA